ncbi:hypothetical protein D3C86_1604350 [compost metagenome]
MWESKVIISQKASGIIQYLFGNVVGGTPLLREATHRIDNNLGSETLDYSIVPKPLLLKFVHDAAKKLDSTQLIPSEPKGSVQ